MTDTATYTPKLLTDAPASTDLLGFKPHAERLAALIQNQIPNKASFVIGIEGEWGEGKSSFINLLKDAFPADDTRPTIVDFNPWWFEGSDQLLRHFFDELLGQIDWTRGDGQKLFDSLSRLAAFAGRVGKLMQLAPEPMLKTAGKVAEGVGQAFGGSSKPESFRKLRDAAADTLAALSFKTIVFIDDLDRLPAREIVELFRVIKAVADLPNIVYVIAYDRAIVASALDQVHKDRGEQYLEKIIQYTYSLPRPHLAAVSSYNRQNLAIAMGVDPEDLSKKAVDLISYAFLCKPRSVKRLSASVVDFRLRSQHLIDIDANDYLFLEALRIFDRVLFVGIIELLLFPGKSQGKKWPSGVLEKLSSRYHGNDNIVDCVRYFIGFDISIGDIGSKPAGFCLGVVEYDENHALRILSEESNRILTGIVRAYLAQHRDIKEVSRLDLRNFLNCKTLEDVEAFLSKLPDDKVLSLFAGVNNYKRFGVWDKVDYVNFIYACASFIQSKLLVGCATIAGDVKCSDMSEWLCDFFEIYHPNSFSKNNEMPIFSDCKVFWCFVICNGKNDTLKVGLRDDLGSWDFRDYVTSNISINDLLCVGGLEMAMKSKAMGLFGQHSSDRNAWLKGINCNDEVGDHEVDNLVEFFNSIYFDEAKNCLSENKGFIAMLKNSKDKLKALDTKLIDFIGHR